MDHALSYKRVATSPAPLSARHGKCERRQQQNERPLSALWHAGFTRMDGDLSGP